MRSQSLRLTPLSVTLLPRHFIPSDLLTLFHVRLMLWSSELSLTNQTSLLQGFPKVLSYRKLYPETLYPRVVNLCLFPRKLQLPRHSLSYQLRLRLAGTPTLIFVHSPVTPALSHVYPFILLFHNLPTPQYQTPRTSWVFS